MKNFRTTLLFALVAGLCLGLAATTFAATTTQVVQKPAIKIGGTAAAGNILVKEANAGTLSATAPNDTFTLTCPAGVSFASGPTAAVTTGDLTLAAAGVPTLTDTDGDSLNDKAVWKITGVSTAASTITITTGTLKLGSGVAAGDVILSLTSEFPGNPGLTDAQAAVATATAANVLVQLTGAPKSVPIGGVATTLGNVSLTEAVAGSLSATSPNNTIVWQLPAGVNFNGAVTAAITGNLAFTALAAVLSDTNADGLNDHAVWTIATASTVPSVVTAAGVQITAAAGVSAGAINGVFTSGTVLNQTLQIATAAAKGIAAVPVASSTAAFSLAPTALTTSPTTPAGRVNVTAASINVKENFSDDLSGAKLALALPAGVTYAGAPTFIASNTVPAQVANPTGFGTFSFTVAAGAAGQGGFVISTIAINVASTVADGDIVATLSGNLDGTSTTTITPINVTIAKVVSSQITITPNTIIPTMGIGKTNNAIGSFKLTESAPQTLLANAATITATLPSGVTWFAAPVASISAGGVTLANTTATLSSSNSVATWSVTAGSTTASIITIPGAISLSASVPAGAVNATIGGTSGASGTVQIATAAYGTTASAGSIPTLTAGLPTQSVSTVILTEAFAGALGAGSFRLVSSVGSWVNLAPTVTVAPTGAYATVGWLIAQASTFANNDTLVITTPGGASSPAAKITLSGLKLNVPAGSTGDVNVALVDGDTTGASSAGIQSASLIMGIVGAATPVSASPATLTVAVGATGEILVSGGVGAITASSDATTVATVAISGTTATVTGVAAGSAVITFSDSASTPNKATVNVTVAAITGVGGNGGTETATAAATDLLDLKLTVDTTAVQQWFVFTTSVGGTPSGIFLLTDAGGTLQALPIEQVTDFAAATFSYPASSVTSGVFSLEAFLGGPLSMQMLGLAAGDTFTYGYAFSATDITAAQFGNIVTITVQ